MTVKKPDNSDDATDEDYINDKTDEDYPEDAFHEVHIYDQTIEDYLVVDSPFAGRSPQPTRLEPRQEKT